MTLMLLAYVLVVSGLVVSYATVFRHHPPEYLDSPYWVGMPPVAVRAVVALQVPAVVGYVAWLATHSLDGLHVAHLLFLAASAAWPVLARECVLRPHSVTWAVAACVPLWVAAACVVYLVAGTATHHHATPVPYLGILAFALVVVLADGVGWTAAAIFRAVNSKT